MADAVAQAAFAFAVVVVAVGVVRSVGPVRGPRPAELAASLSVGLEFFLAAGLLRLSALNDFTSIGVVAGIVVLRRIIGAGIRFGLRALGAARVGGVRA